METKNDPVPQAVPQPVQSFNNTSGQKENAIIPPEIRGWSWAAFLFGWIWGIGNQTYIALLCLIPFVGLIMPFVLGVNGNEWAWRNKHWESIEQFKKTQRAWVKWWFIIVGIFLVITTAFIIWAVSITSVNEKAATAFLKQLSSGQVTAAYNSTTASFQSSTSFEDFKTFVAKNPVLIEANTSYFSSRSIKNGRVEFSGNLKGQDGKTSDIDIVERMENGQWKVSAMEYSNYPQDSNSSVQTDPQNNDLAFPQEVSNNAKMVFNSKTYTIADKLSSPAGADYTAESYEWVKKGETADNWTSLITTHKLTPLSQSKPLSAKDYAQNVAALQEKNGAVILEASVINTPDAKAQGVDISNPPYLLVYVFQNSNPAQPSEFDIQKIQNMPQGEVSSIIYGQQLQIKSSQDLKAYLASDLYAQNRKQLVLSKFPY